MRRQSGEELWQFEADSQNPLAASGLLAGAALSLIGTCNAMAGGRYPVLEAVPFPVLEAVPFPVLEAVPFPVLEAVPVLEAAMPAFCREPIC